MPKPDKGKLTPVAHAILALAAGLRAKAGEWEAKPDEELDYADGLRQAADELEQFARS